ncbi:MAG TPA: hypothetical protein VF928_03095 [Usitatibacteraceae bacterium]
MNQRWMAALVGPLGLYHLIHAWFAGYSAILLYDILRMSRADIDLVAPEHTREIFKGLCIVAVVFGGFGLLSLTASFGFWGNKNWAHRLWIGTSVSMILSIVAAIAFWNRDLAEYVFELAVITFSWLRLKKLRRSG